MHLIPMAAPHSVARRKNLALVALIWYAVARTLRPRLSVVVSARRFTEHVVRLIEGEEWQSHREGRARAVPRTFRGDGPVVQSHQRADDGQSQPKPTIGPRHRAVGLPEP